MKISPRKTLLVVAESPWSRSSGGQQRIALLRDALADVAPVDVLVIQEGNVNEASAGDHQQVVARLCWKQPPLTVYKFGIHRWVNDWCHAKLDFGQYDLVVGRDITPITKIKWPAQLRKVVDCDDVYYRYAPDGDTPIAHGVAAGKTIMRYWQAKLALRQFDHVFFCSPRDQRLFTTRSSSILPNVVSCRDPSPCASEVQEPTALIVGSMAYPPNRQGVDWFLERCWPVVAERCPSLRLRIVGAVDHPIRKRWSLAPRTEALGFVENLAGEYSSALFTIAPVLYGGGSCIKFLEAAAYGRACIVTGHVWEPFREDFREGESVVVGHDAGAMINACVALFGDPGLRAAVARRAHEIVSRLYTHERFRRQVFAALDRIKQSVMSDVIESKAAES